MEEECGLEELYPQYGVRDIVQQTIDSIQKAIDEADKTASVKRIERVLGGDRP